MYINVHMYVFMHAHVYVQAAPLACAIVWGHPPTQLIFMPVPLNKSVASYIHIHIYIYMSIYIYIYINKIYAYVCCIFVVIICRQLRERFLSQATKLYCMYLDIYIYIYIVSHSSIYTFYRGTIIKIKSFKTK